MKTRPILAVAPLALVITACSQGADAPATEASASATATTAATPVPAPKPDASPREGSGAQVLTLEGLGDLIIGKPIPAGSSFQMRGAQASDTCLLFSSPDFPGVYAMTEGGKELRRITVSGVSKIKLVEGIGLGATEQEVLAAFPGFVATPHEYVGPKGKYLTQPGSDPRLRFETGEDGKVTAIHVGMRPQLEYSEGCA